MRTNEEQLKAIESSGSVLLSAGAGSGKTYVLVEHIMFLAKKFIERESKSGGGNFSGKIKKYFSGIVLITFTRKSTSEIRLRVKKRMEREASCEGTQKDVWESVLGALPLLTISTIHGFCSLLLRQGFFPGFGRSFEIMGEIERRKWIEKLFAEWFELEKKKDSFEREEKNYETIVANVDSIVKGLVKIFNDPMLRNTWNRFPIDDIKNAKLGDFIKEYLSCVGIDEIFSFQFAVGSGNKASKWQLLLNDFYRLAEKGRPPDSIEELRAFEDLFSSYPRIVLPKATEENKNARKQLEGIKKFKKFLVDHQEDLAAFEEHRDKMYQWAYLFNLAFDYIEKNCWRNSRMSYSDLEYYVFEGLADKNIVDKISDVYQYIVVDEFQDTSLMQFEIIKKIVKSDYKKLFCVGDYKQAIYGFRGGEIAVFDKCRDEMENNLNLASNYRSEKTIVEFNNRFFGALLNCGDSFDNIDSGKFQEAFQHSEKDVDEGVVFRHKVIVSDKKTDAEKIEAKRIFDLIDSMKEAGDVSEIAVLYKRLAPSKFLMEHLLSNKIPFVAQVKVPYGEDFVVGLCMILLEFYLSWKERKRTLEKLIDYPKFMLLSYFNLMGLDGPENLTQHLRKFLTDINLYGFESAFCVFIYDLGISNSHYGQNVKIIKDLYGMFGEDLEGIYNSLKKNSEEKYSMDVQFGKKSEGEMNIVIMTVHSSKGLEFEQVILGGIHGAGRGGQENHYIGKHPAAIKWKSASGQKKPFRSPEFILEKYLHSQKDFAESKRLFYVACTRAVKGLHWVDVYVKQKKINERSWVMALRKWCDLSLFDGINYREDSLAMEEGECTLSLRTDGWGIVERDNKRVGLILPEISVSGFVSVTQCPRKFYLQNVCRFEKDTKGVFLGADLAERENAPLSSVARGSALHGKISDMIEGGWESLPESGKDGDGQILRWVQQALAPFYEAGVAIFSEIPVKFSFSGQVISGTADLVAFDRERGLLEVWDFKSGRRDDSYWFQLFCYAYGFARRYGLKGEQSINMAIVYLDKKDIIKKTLVLSRITREIEREWAKTNNLSRVNREHCSSCCYENLCHP